jgi:hypothetical protein
VASGVLVAKGDRVFIATAAHYLDDVPLKIMTVVFPPNEWDVAKDLAGVAKKLRQSGDWKALAAHAVPVNAVNHWRGNVREDIALLEIEPVIVPKWCVIYDLEKHKGKAAMPGPGEKVLLAGVPAGSRVLERKKAKEVGAPDEMHVGRIALEHMFSVVAVPDPKEWKDKKRKQSFMPRYHFALDYDLKKVPSGILPWGLSGGGVWRPGEGKSPGGLPIPDPILLGIEVTYFEERGQVKVTSTSRLRALLE